MWTVWHHRHHRLGSVLPICYLKMELIFPLPVAFCRLSSLLLVGLTSRSWMCWMKIAGDWSQRLCRFVAYVLAPYLVDCGVVFLFAPFSLFLRCYGLKWLACFLFIWNYCPKFTFHKIILALPELWKAFSSAHRKCNNFFQWLCWPILSAWFHLEIWQRDCWTECDIWDLSILLVFSFLI